MKLNQLELPLDETLAEELSISLEDLASSISWYEVNPKEWILSIIFEEKLEALLKKIIKDFYLIKKLTIPDFVTRAMPKTDWVNAVYQNFPPLTIGRFYIYGSHNSEIPPSDLIPLHIEAATAFGSGQHESTEGCLRALSLLKSQQTFVQPLDMGCGSGILALAMAALWKVPVLACDNDPEAVRVTLENGHKNSLDHLLDAEVHEGFSALPHNHFDIITANILAGPLCHMAADVKKVLKPTGYIILAGLLTRQADSVIEAYTKMGIKYIEQLFINDWSTIIMQKSKDE